MILKSLLNQKKQYLINLKNNYNFFQIKDIYDEYSKIKEF